MTKEFKPTVEMIKNQVCEYADEHGNPLKCSDEQAQAILNNWNTYLDDYFYEFLKGEIYEGDILNDWEED